MSALHQIAISLIPGIGSNLAKNLIAYCGGVEAVFQASEKELSRVPGIGKNLSSKIRNTNVFERAEKELKFVEDKKIQLLFYTDKNYPQRLKSCSDAPLILFYKGSQPLNTSKLLSIVGTRRITAYGREVCNKIIHDLKELDVIIVSGMAYGADTCAHKAALEHGLNTIGVFAHGLDMVYPGVNRALAATMIHRGGLLTEFYSGTTPNKENFPRRNRIVAGMSDATLVIESGQKGGALITAEIAGSYNKDVFAVPGRIGDKLSIGTNNLIKKNKAALVESAEDIIYYMNWGTIQTKSKLSKQTRLLLTLSPEEEAVIEALEKNNLMEVDQLEESLGICGSQLAGTLLNLEFQNVIKCLPGKIYKLNTI